jgi:hypothetical protein
MSRLASTKCHTKSGVEFSGEVAKNELRKAGAEQRRDPFWSFLFLGMQVKESGWEWDINTQR